jgi:hypothetical protein
MSWGRRRNQNVRDYSREHVLTNVKGKLNNRLHLFADPDISPLEVYRGLWNKDEAAALKALRQRYTTILREDSDFEVQWDISKFAYKPALAPGRVFTPTKLYVYLPRELPVPQTEEWRSEGNKVNLSQLPLPLQEKLIPWGKKFVQADVDTDLTIAKVDSCFSVCNTMGQIKRVWPNLCSFLPERAQEILRNAKVRSRLPEDVVETDLETGKTVLVDDWNPKTLVPFDMIITESLILPERESEGDFRLKVAWRSDPAV